MKDKPNYTCKDYRQEMILEGLRRRFNDEHLSGAERVVIKKEIEKMESEMNLD